MSHITPPHPIYSLIRASGETTCGLIRLLSDELVLVRSIGGKEYIGLLVGRRSWRKEGAGGRRDMVVDRRDMVQKYDKI